MDVPEHKPNVAQGSFDLAVTKGLDVAAGVVSTEDEVWMRGFSVSDTKLERQSGNVEVNGLRVR